jgi:hypothetical protein
VFPYIQHWEQTKQSLQVFGATIALFIHPSAFIYLSIYCHPLCIHEFFFLIGHSKLILKVQHCIENHNEIINKQKKTMENRRFV